MKTIISIYISAYISGCDASFKVGEFNVYSDTDLKAFALKKCLKMAEKEEYGIDWFERLEQIDVRQYTINDNINVVTYKI